MLAAMELTRTVDMGITDTGPGVEILEELLRDAPRAEPTGRAQLRRRRLQFGFRAIEYLSGGLGGAALGVVIGGTFLETVAAIASYMVAWRFLGTIFGICTDTDARPWSSTLAKAKDTVLMALVLSWLTVGALVALGAPNAVAAAFVAAVVGATVAMNGRGLVHALMLRARDTRQRTLIIGSGEVARKVVERLRLAPHLSVETIGLIDDDVHEGSPDLPRLGALEDLEEVLRRYEVDRVIIAFTRAGHDELLRCIRVCWDNHVAVDIVPRLFEFLDGARTIDQIGGLPMMSITLPQLSLSARAFKRAADLVLSLLLIVLLSPLLLVTAIAIKLDSPGPVFFRQERIGRGGRPFRIFKFRSMYLDAEQRKQDYMDINDVTDGVMFKIHDDPRITRVGKFLRRWSIDELPQLFNVLRGEMSLVGPRPLIAEETAAFSESWHRRRLDLRPGMTGPWQIYGRSDIPFPDMLRFDYQYVAGWSLGRDLHILLATVPALYAGRGAY